MLDYILSHDILTGEMPSHHYESVQHVDFAISTYEIGLCHMCRYDVDIWLYPTCTSHQIITVAPTIAHPVGGLLGICQSCWRGHTRRRNGKKQLLARCGAEVSSLLRFVPVVPDAPIQYIARGACNDVRLAELIIATFARIPHESRAKIIDFSRRRTTCKVGTGVRIEALKSWTHELRNAVGENSNRGHVIRLHAGFVSDCLRGRRIALLQEVIAHEFAHTLQDAESKRFLSVKACEDDVEARLLAWNLKDSHP